ncbi:hypothetical protein RRG08_039197 [Elysia crispata]|uniref:Uncharacterized protein n=1 Tax=Elysia crispata TaxID=231223 RepID=A0AAE1AU18_9GAST|nr:hypothetical protein RRG08_039197 [Elysia crispata]
MYLDQHCVSLDTAISCPLPHPPEAIGTVFLELKVWMRIYGTFSQGTPRDSTSLTTRALSEASGVTGSPKAAKLSWLDMKSSDMTSRKEMDSDNEVWLNAIGDGKKRATACLKVNNCEVRFQVDTAADVNTIQQRFVKKEQVTKSDQTLVMWNETKMTPLGETKLQVLNEKTGQTLPVKFTVVKNNLNCLLSLTTCQDLSLVTINHEKLIAQTTEEPGTLVQPV